MAYVITAKILVDDDNEIDAYLTFSQMIEPFIGQSVIDFLSERIVKVNTDGMATDSNWTLYQNGDQK